MAKYQGAYREDVYKEELPVQNVVEEQDDIESGDPEEGTFKKRYGDLRRHMQQMMQQKDAEMAQMRDQLDRATRQQIRFPKTDAEVAEWAKKYPDVAKIVDTIAQKRVQEALAIGEKKLAGIQKLEQKIEREKAEQELRRLHPDFDEIRANPKFHEWVSEQPQWVQDSLYKNNTDARAAARAIDLYKADAGIKKKRVSSSSDAAKSVGRATGASVSNGKARFKESQVAKMSAAEFEKNEAAITDAMRNGLFEYDLSGKAA